MKSLQWHFQQGLHNFTGPVSFFLYLFRPGLARARYPANCKIRAAMYASLNAVFMRAAQTSANMLRGSRDQVHTLTFAFAAAMEVLMFNPAMSTSHGPEPIVQINITFVLRARTKSLFHY
jgi:hypothetical protein